MIKKNIKVNGKIHRNTSKVGETIETKMERVVNNGEPIEDTAPIIYQDKYEGVNKAYDIRTDKWDVALEGMTHVHKSEMAKMDVEKQKIKENKENTGNHVSIGDAGGDAKK